MLKFLFGAFIGLPRNVYYLCLAYFINALGHFVFPFLALILTDRLGRTAGQAGQVIMLITLASSCSPFIGAIIADKWGRKKIFITSQLISSACLFSCLFFLDSFIMIYFLAAFTIAASMNMAAANSMVADSTTGEQKKMGFSLLHLSHNLGMAIGPLLASFFYRRNFALFFGIDAFTILLAVLLVTFGTKEVFKREKEEEKNHSSFLTIFKNKKMLLFLICGFFLSVVYIQQDFALPLHLQKFFSKGVVYYSYLLAFNCLIVSLFSGFINQVTAKISSHFNLVLSGVFYTVGFGMMYFTPESFSWMFVWVFIWTCGEILMVANYSSYLSNLVPAHQQARILSLPSIIFTLARSFGSSAGGKFIDLYGVENIWASLGLVGLIFSTILAMPYFFKHQNQEPLHSLS